MKCNHFYFPAIFLGISLLSVCWGCDSSFPNRIEAEQNFQWKEGQTTLKTEFTWGEDLLSVHDESLVFTLYTRPSHSSDSDGSEIQIDPLTTQSHQWTLVIDLMNPDHEQKITRSQTDLTSILHIEKRQDEDGSSLPSGLLGQLTLPLCDSISPDPNRPSSLPPQKCLPCPEITQLKCQQEGCQCQTQWTLIRGKGPFNALESRFKLSLSQRTPTLVKFNLNEVE